MIKDFKDMSIDELEILKQELLEEIDMRKMTETNDKKLLFPERYKSLELTDPSDNRIYDMVIGDNGKLLGYSKSYSLDDSCGFDVDIIFGKVNYCLIADLFKISTRSFHGYKLYRGAYKFYPVFGILDAKSSEDNCVIALQSCDNLGWVEVSDSYNDRIFVENFRNSQPSDRVYESVYDEYIDGIEEEISSNFEQIGKKKQDLRYILRLFNK